MKKLLLFALVFATTLAFSQGKTLFEISMVKPKTGQFSTFESSWKAHLAKFHNGDDKRTVYEILSGPYTGYYYLVEGPMSYADMDKERPNNAMHDQDYEKTVAHHLQDEGVTNIFSLRDSLSYNTDIQADKFVVTVTQIKDGKMSEYLQEARRATMLSTKIKAPFGQTTFVQSFAGSNPVVVRVRTLKDGFKELETNYNNRPPTIFRDSYLKEHSQEQWDKRVKLLEESEKSREVHLMKLRKDLSSKQ